MGDRYRSTGGGRDRAHDDNVEYFGAGESYRPGGHTGQGPYRPPNRQPTDSWSSDRRDRDRDRDRDRERVPERDPRREADIDSYIPPTSSRARPKSRSPSFRQRSRTPPTKGRGDLFDDRPPRRPSPRRDDRARSPPRRRSRSPYGRKSPDPRRERDYSPDRSYTSRARSPPKRSSYRSRSRTPPRRNNADDNWRRRSPSPRPESSGPSRRSSPPVHPDRISSVPRSPERYDTEMTDDYQQNGTGGPPTGPSRSNGYDRPPPSGPSRGFSQSGPGGPPTGPSMSAHNRGGPPTRPRGGGYGAPARDFTSPPMRGRGSLTYRAPAAPRSTSYSDAPPVGPRAGGFGRGDFGGSSYRGEYAGGARGGGFGRGSAPSNEAPPFPFRSSNNSTSTTYPRTQRFNTVQSQLASVEKVVPGGKLLPSGLSVEQEQKLKQLEAESERIRQELAEKQKVKRDALNEWEVRERESERESLRSELAEVQGEEAGMAAF